MASLLHSRNGCFWGRQKDFVDVEKTLGRTPDKVSAVVGYAGGRQTGGPIMAICYVIYQKCKRSVPVVAAVVAL